MKNVINEVLDKLEVSAHSEEFLERNGLNWKVETRPLFTADGEEAPALAVQRLDNGDILGVVGPRYEPFQNERMVEIIQRIADKANLDMAKAFIMNHGAKIAVQLHTTDYPNIGNNNGTIEGYITVINSHDGTTGLRFGNSNTDIVCRNTFYRAYRGLGEQFSFRHTSTINALVDNALWQIDKLRAAEEEIVETYKRMSSVPGGKQLAAQLVLELTGVDRLVANFDPANYTPYQLDREGLLVKCINEEVAYKGDTAWGLFSGVTKFTTHHMRAPKRDNGRVESKMFGSAQEWDQKAYRILSSI